MFEFYNPHPSAMDLSFRSPIGQVRVQAGQAIPTPEMEKQGLTANIFEEFVIPNLLHPTPPVVRRRLFQEGGLEVPADLVAATAHLPEFSGVPQSPEPPRPAAVPSPFEGLTRVTKSSVRHVVQGPPKDSATKAPSAAPNLEQDMQALSDRLCSSGRPKNIENPE